MLELMVTLALSALVMAPLAAILWQVTAAPVETSAVASVAAQVRNTDINIPDDGRSSQSVVTGDNPVWATIAWTDFTGSTAKYHSVDYAWDSGAESMVRTATIEGTADTPFTVGRFLDKFADADIRLNESLAPFLLEVAVFPEIETPTGSQAQTGSLVSFMRGPSALPPSAGGYTVFSTGKVNVRGSRNGVIGNVHSNTDIEICGSDYHTAGFLETTGDISCSDEIDVTEKLFLHNDPTPPTADTAAHAVLLMDEAAPTGTSLFNYDTDRDSQPGLLIRRSNKGVGETDPARFQSWRTAILTSDLLITGDVIIDVWAAFKDFEQAAEQGHITIFLRDRDATGDYTEIARGERFESDWPGGSSTFVKKSIIIPAVNYTVSTGHQLEAKLVVQKTSKHDMWFAYDTVTHPSVIRITFKIFQRAEPFLFWHNHPTPPGSDTFSQGQAVVLPSPNGNPEGITTDGTSIWVADGADDLVYRYDLFGGSTGTFSLTGANGDATGITTDGTSIWVVDDKDDLVYQYDLLGNSTGSFNLTGANKDPSGITTDGSSIWVVDDKDDEVYQYDLSGNSTSSFVLTGANKDATGITTDGSSIWVVDDKDALVYQYDLSGNNTGSFPLRTGNGRSVGITTDGASFLRVPDSQDKAIYIYKVDGTFITALPMDETTPTATTLFNYDFDRTFQPGLALRQSNLGVAETDPKKFQTWSKGPLTGDLTITEGVMVDFWAGTKNFVTGRSGEVSIFLRDFDPATSSYTEIGSLSVFEADWQAGSTTFVQKTIIAPDLSYTIVAGHELHVKAIVDKQSQADMWFAYDTATFPAVLYVQPDVVEVEIPEGPPEVVQATIEYINEAAATKPLPVTFNTSEFQPFDFSFVGDVSLGQKPSVWLDAERTQLRPGVYHATGSLVLGGTGDVINGLVTFIARDINLSGSDFNLTPYQNGVTSRQVV